MQFKIEFVIGDRECGAIEFAKANGIKNFVINYQKDNHQELHSLLNKFSEVDIIITNIHKIIDTASLKRFEKKYINLHYSLLPAYGGLIGMKTIVKAKHDNAMFIGATCHEVTEILDGGRIICQSSIAVNWDDDLSEIFNSVFKSACFILLNSILMKVEKALENSRTNEIVNVQYNPPLHFETKSFTNQFWAQLM